MIVLDAQPQGVGGPGLTVALTGKYSPWILTSVAPPWPADGDAAQVLVAVADSGLYLAKRRGRNQVGRHATAGGPGGTPAS